MPLLESLIGLTQRGIRREHAKSPVDARDGVNDARFDGSLIAGGEDTWTPSGGAGSRGTEPVSARKVTALGALIEGARKECGNVFCRSVWTPPWKSREQPIFEGRWACSPGCAEALVRSALARETGEWPEDDVPEPHRHRVPLGLVLLAHGWITHAKLQRALEAQRANGFGRIGEWLISEAGVSAEEVTRGLSAQWNCPVLTVDGFSPQTTALALPRLFIEEYGALPLRVVGGKVLYVGFCDQLDAAASFAIEQMSGLKTESGVMGEANFRRARERLLDCRFPSLSIAEETDRDALAESVAATIERVRPTASRLLKLHRYYWLRVWSNGAECRPGSTLPMSLDGVTDHLFTIASHRAVGARRWLFQQPDATRMNGQQSGERADRRTAVSTDDKVAAAKRVTGGKLEGAKLRSEEPIEAAVLAQNVKIEVPIRADDDADKDLAEIQESEAELIAKPVTKLPVREAALAIVDQNAMEKFEAQEPSKSRQAASDESFYGERMIARREPVEEMRHPPAAGTEDHIGVGQLETIEGEYLPLEVVDCESTQSDGVPEEAVAQSATGFLSLHRRSDWKQFQAWSQKSLSLLRRAEHPLSGPDQEG